MTLRLGDAYKHYPTSLLKEMLDDVGFWPFHLVIMNELDRRKEEV